MSYSLDANILIYASNKDSAHYEQAIDFLGDCMSEPDPLYLCWPTVFAYLRIATHPSIFASPLSPDEAIRNIESLRLASHVRFISEGEDFWSCYEPQCSGEPRSRCPHCSLASRTGRSADLFSGSRFSKVPVSEGSRSI